MQFCFAESLLYVVQRRHFWDRMTICRLPREKKIVLPYVSNIEVCNAISER